MNKTLYPAKHETASLQAIAKPANRLVEWFDVGAEEITGMGDG